MYSSYGYEEFTFKIIFGQRNLFWFITKKIFCIFQQRQPASTNAVKMIGKNVFVILDLKDHSTHVRHRDQIIFHFNNDTQSTATQEDATTNAIDDNSQQLLDNEPTSQSPLPVNFDTNASHNSSTTIPRDSNQL